MSFSIDLTVCCLSRNKLHRREDVDVGVLKFRLELRESQGVKLE